jgi:hypothetical protein
MMMEAKRVALRFKGARNYIHGTDIFNLMIACYPDEKISNIRFSIHDFVRTPICKVYSADTKDELSSLDAVCVRCQFNKGDTTCWLAMCQGEGDFRSGARYDYSEEKIISLCILREGWITLTDSSPFSFIENVVAMNKHMHEKMFPEVDGKWVFSRIDLESFQDIRRELSLSLKHNMGNRLTKSDIQIGERKIGEIYFSLVRS